MRILYLLQDFPYPPTDGIRWKPYNLLSYMAQRHECHVLSFGDGDSTGGAEEWGKSLAGLRVLGLFPLPSGWQLKTQQARHLLKGNPPSLARWESSAMAEAIRQASRSYTYDVVHYDIINMAQYRPLLRGFPGVLSTNDAMVMRYLRSAQAVDNPFRKMVWAFAAWRLAVYETKALREFDALHVVSQIDADYIMKRNPSVANLEVIGVCAEPGFLKIPLTRTDHNESATAILFTSGNLRLPHISEPLLRFVSTGFKRIRQLRPNVEFVVIGRNAPLEVAKSLSAEPNVRFATWVADYVQVLAEADIAVFLDEAGSGIKNRVMQALAAGKPVVGTPVALEGIAVTGGLNAYVCGSSDEATEAVLKLLESADLRSRLGSAARELICRHYTQGETGRQWETLYQRVIEGEHVSNTTRARLMTNEAQ